VKNAKAKIATGATVVLLGGLGGIALSQGGKAPSKPVADKPVVHTKVIRRTVHVTKHAKPKHPPAGAPVEPRAGSSSAAGSYVTTASSGAGAESAPVTTASSGSESSETAPVTTGSSGSGSESAPVTTATSGGGGGGEVGSDDGGGEAEHESEGGDD
jgi:hypothetical protein